MAVKKHKFHPYRAFLTTLAAVFEICVLPRYARRVKTPRPAEENFNVSQTAVRLVQPVMCSACVLK